MAQKKSFVEPASLRCRQQIDWVGDSLTHQAHKDEADVNKIVGRYARTGQLPEPRKGAAYADVSGLQADLTQRINESRDITSKVKKHVEDTKKKIQEEEREIIRAARQRGNSPATESAPVASAPVAAGASAVQPGS